MRAAGIDRSPEWRHCSSEKQKWLQYQKWKLCFATRELIHQTQALRIICSSWKFLQAEWWLACFRLVENLLNHGTGGNTVFNRVLCCTLTFHYTGGQLTACWAGGSCRTPVSICFCHCLSYWEKDCWALAPHACICSCPWGLSQSRNLELHATASPGQHRRWNQKIKIHSPHKKAFLHLLF